MAIKDHEPWNVATAAEAFAAGVFSLTQCKVSVQYGANQPEYDLMISRSDRVLKVSVKGSQDGGWGLTQNFKKDCSYHIAAEKWMQRHTRGTILCFVQFQGFKFDTMPRIYLATPQEVCSRLIESCRGRGETILYESHTWKSGHGAGTTESIPETWKFSPQRVAELFDRVGLK